MTGACDLLFDLEDCPLHAITVADGRTVHATKKGKWSPPLESDLGPWTHQDLAFCLRAHCRWIQV